VGGSAKALSIRDNPPHSPFIEPVTAGLARASLGAGVIALPGVHVGVGSMVGAGSVVTKDVPPAAVIVDNPARPVRKARWLAHVI
jgi:tetrahydrodipicolinate N-succinyltransferase